MGVECLGLADRIAADRINGLYSDRWIGRPAPRRIGELRIIVADELHAIGGGDEHAAVGLNVCADAHDLRKLLHQGIALVEKSTSRVAVYDSVLNLRIDVRDLLDEGVGLRN